MDLQTRKLKVIEYLIGLRDEKMFGQIESIIVEVQKLQRTQAGVKPFSVEQLVDRANKSTRDYLSGKYTTQEQLEKESDNW